MAGWRGGSRDRAGRDGDPRGRPAPRRGRLHRAVPGRAGCAPAVGSGGRRRPGVGGGARNPKRRRRGRGPARRGADRRTPPPPRALTLLALATASRNRVGAPPAARGLARALAALARLAPLGGVPSPHAVAALAEALRARLSPDPLNPTAYRSPAGRHVATALHSLGALRAAPDPTLAAAAARALKATRARQPNCAVALQGLALLASPPPPDAAAWLAARAAGGGDVPPRDAARVLWSAAVLGAPFAPPVKARLVAVVAGAARDGTLTRIDAGYVVSAAEEEGGDDDDGSGLAAVAAVLR